MGLGILTYRKQRVAERVSCSQAVSEEPERWASGSMLCFA